MNKVHAGGQVKIPRLQSGVQGLDRILGGGFLLGRSYLITGEAGSGKTTLGLHFLAQADPADALLVSLGEPQANIRADAASIGLDIELVACIDVSLKSEVDQPDGTYTLLHPWEAEPPNLITRIASAFPDKLPSRVFIDALSSYRYLFADAFQFRRQILELMEYMGSHQSTVLISSEANSDADRDLQYLGDGIIKLEAKPNQRSLIVSKFRGSEFAEGEHSVRLTKTGMHVFQRLVPAEHHKGFVPDKLSSGIPQIDDLIGGGVDRGTVTLISGPSGVGKTTLGTQFMREAARHGNRAVIFSFEERTDTLRFRCQSISLPLDDVIAKNELSIREIEPLRFGPDEFAWEVRKEVEERGAQIVMIDSLAGYRQSVQDDDISRHVHALCRYLGNMGVTVILINEVATIAGGEVKITDIGISYLADAVVLMRYVELNGTVSKSIGMLKKRTGDFEKEQREFKITQDGLSIGSPLISMNTSERFVTSVSSSQKNDV